MTPGDITALVGALVAFVSSIVIPLLLARRAKEREAALKLGEDKAAEGVNWVSFSAALSRERDTLQKRIEDKDVDHARQIEAVRATADQEMRTMQSRYDDKLARANAKISDLEKQIEALFKRIFAMEGGKPPSSRDTP